MQIIFDIKQQCFRHKARLVVGGHVVESSEHTAYSSTIKDTSARLMLMIALKNGFGIMAGDLGNSFFIAPCAENIWSICD